MFDDIELPELPADPDQKMVDELAKKVANQGHENIRRGFHAASPDLAFLKRNLQKLVNDGKVKTEEQVGRFLQYCVQRVKQYAVYQQANGRFLKVVFKTKSDLGWFVFEFGLNIDVPIEDAQLYLEGMEIGMVTFRLRPMGE